MLALTAIRPSREALLDRAVLAVLGSQLFTRARMLRQDVQLLPHEAHRIRLAFARLSALEANLQRAARRSA